MLISLSLAGSVEGSLIGRAEGFGGANRNGIKSMINKKRSDSRASGFAGNDLRPHAEHPHFQELL